MAKPTLSPHTRSTIPPKAVEDLTSTDMEVISTSGMATVQVAMDTMADSEVTTPMATAMVTTVEVMDSTEITQKLRRICHKSPASSARKLVTMQTIARRRSLMN